MDQDPTALSEGVASKVADFFSAFSDTSRVRIISVLTRGEMNVGSIAKLVGISESAVSHHLRALRQLRLVRAHKIGRQVFYSLDDEHIIEIYKAGVYHVQHE
jgi:ArsR family transcriptional regulator